VPSARTAPGWHPGGSTSRKVPSRETSSSPEPHTTGSVEENRDVGHGGHVRPGQQLEGVDRAPKKAKAPGSPGPLS
jgi:hypothetical protein